MAEVFGIITGVIGVVSPFVSQVEQFVQRCEAIIDNPTSVKRLARDCSELQSRLLQLQRDLSDPDRKQLAADDLDVFRPTVEDVTRYFQSAKNDLDELERSFPSGRTSSRAELFRKALHKCKHFVLANKVAASVDNISQTIDKAKSLLNPLIYDFETYIAVKETLVTVKQGLSASAETPADEFQPCFLVPAMLPNIVLDFCSHENGKPITMEGKLKNTLLSLDDHQGDSAALAVAVGVAGMGGVGKTSALIGLGWERDLRDRFIEGGVYFVSVGKDATVPDIINSLGHLVKSTGGIQCAKDIFESETLSAAVGEVAQWFQGHRSLFLFDDLWETMDNKVGYLPYLKQILSSCAESKMVVSTRSDEIALEGGKPVKFAPGEPNGEQSRRILLEYAGIYATETAEFSKASKEALETVLSKCGGVPLTLAVAGRAIRQMTFSCSGSCAEAVVVYARDLEAEISCMRTESIGLYPSFEATIRTSLSVADRWSEEYELRQRTGGRTSCSKLFTALCVLPMQMRVPREMLKRLWRIADDRVIHEVVRKFVDLNLLSERRSSGGGSAIGAHDLILEYCQGAAGTEAQTYHAALLSEHFPNEGDMPSQCTIQRRDNSPLSHLAETVSRPWWEFDSHPYLSEHICRHLAKGGLVGELVALLCDFRWTEVRVRSSELLRWHEDFNCVFSALQNKKHGVEDVKEGLEKIRDAAHDGWGFAANNPHELAFQIQSRLIQEGTTSSVATTYIESIYKFAKKPWLKCGEQCWPHPGTAQTAVIYLSGRVQDLKLAKRGRIGVVACGKTVLILSIDRRCIIRTLAHSYDVKNVAVSSDGNRIISRGFDGSVRLWDGTSGEAMGELLCGHEQEVECLAVSRDGRRIVSGSDDGTLRMWDLTRKKTEGEPLRGHENEVECVAVSGDGKRIVSGSGDNTVRIWDVSSGQPVGQPLCGFEGWVTCVAVNRNGRRVVAGSEDHTIRIWDGTNGKAVGGPLIGHKDWVTSVAVSDDGRYIVSGSLDGTTQMWDGESGAAIGEPLREHEDEVRCVAMSAGGGQIVSGSYDGTVRIWDRTSGNAIGNQLSGHNARVTCLAVSRDGRCIASGSQDGTVRIWDGKNGKAVSEPFHGHNDEVKHIAMSGDGKRIVSGASDGTVRFWDGSTGEAVGEPLHGHKQEVSCVTASGNGNRIVSGSLDFTLRMWDGTNGMSVGEPLQGHEDEVMCVAVSEDGKRIISGSDDGTVRIWDGTNGIPIGKPLRGHFGGVLCLAVTGDGSRIVSGGSDGKVRVWDGESGMEACQPLHAHCDRVTCVAVSRDGKRVFSGSRDGTLRVWDMTDSSFEGTVITEGRDILSLGNVIRAEAENGDVKYWCRDEEAGLMEMDRSVRNHSAVVLSARHYEEKWEAQACGRQVIVRNREDNKTAVLATLPFKAIYGNWGSLDCKASVDDLEDGDVLGPFVVWFENNLVLSFSLVV